MRARNRISPLQVEVSWDGVVATVTAAGEVDLASATSLAGRLRSVAATHPERLVLDLGGLVFADMAAARTLEAVHQALGAECPVIVRKPRLAAREAFGLPRPAGGPDGRRVPVPDTSYPLRMAGGVPVVTTPAEIDPASAGSLRAVLQEWHTRGHSTVVVDMTGSRFCDSAGLTVLVLAHKRAAAQGGGLRLVLPAEGVVARLFIITGLDRVIPHFASRGQALAQVRARAIRSRRASLRVASPAAPASLPAHGPEHSAGADSRRCEQCGAEFVPRREHARFCSAGCRAAWNREHLGDPTVDASALAWSVTALAEATGRLPAVKVWDRAGALEAIEEAVWWITMVDATLVRHHPGTYDAAMAARGPAQRAPIEQTLGGLRFLRNQIGRGTALGDVIKTGKAGASIMRITGWRWKPIPEPALGSLSPRGQAWELARHRAYQAHMAGHTLGETLGRAATFLTLTGTTAASTTDTNERTSRS